MASGLAAAARSVPPSGKLSIQRVKLPGQDANATLELERFSPFAPGAVIVVQADPNSPPVRAAPPNTAYFRGTIAGRPESQVVVHVEANGAMGGMAVDGQREWKLTKPAGGVGGATGSVAADAPPLSATAVNATAEPQQAPFRCGVKHGATVDPEEMGRSRHIAAVIGLADVVYSREIGVDIVLGYVRFWTGSDPYTSNATLYTDSLLLLKALTTTPRTLTFFMSGGDPYTLGGIAWNRGTSDTEDLSVLCDWAYYKSTNKPASNRGYGLCAGMGGNVGWTGDQTKNPSAVTWCNLGGDANTVDNCVASEAACPQTNVGKLPTCGTPTPYFNGGPGTIMSYCHLLSGGDNNNPPIAQTGGRNDPIPVGNLPWTSGVLSFGSWKTNINSGMTTCYWVLSNSEGFLFTFTTPAFQGASASVTVSTCDFTTEDTVIGVWNADGTTCVATDDNGSCGPSSEALPTTLAFNAAPSTTYLIGVSSPSTTWNATLAAGAQAWAETCDMVHSAGPWGENIFASYGRAYPYNGLDACQTATNDWYSEIDNYNFTNPKTPRNASFEYGATGHFTQVVWAASTQVGCGVKTCADGWTYVVCRYLPAGNDISNNYDRFPRNVYRTACQNATADDGCSTCSGSTCTACYTKAVVTPLTNGRTCVSEKYKTQFAVNATGVLRISAVDAKKPVQLLMTATGRARVTINGAALTALTTDVGTTAATKTVSLTLPAGDARITIEWMQVSGTSRIKLLWKTATALAWGAPRLFVS
ncbi:Pry1p [Chlorella sorokiniana]|uniref:Pry1p n=1 Tax=Chlorella sorokiniana TaxID=3076 RepID=A0A2P6TW57_CHLSO|nr:Pry1p [Chlorella sorokiniana]|eukprot:PRW58296.1 Pry1p [Chlorella sorokiniana]